MKWAAAFAPLAMVLSLSSCAELFGTTTPDTEATTQKTPEEKAGAPEEKGGQKEDVGKTAEEQGKAGEDKTKTTEASKAASTGTSTAVSAQKKKEAVVKTADEQGRVLDEKIKAIEASNKALREKTAAMEQELSALKTRNEAIYKSVTNEYSSATIDTTARDFAVAKNPYGSFLIACDGIAPVPNGYEVKLSIGNLTSASYDHYKLRVKWGDRSVEFKRTSPIPPGTWAKVSVILAPAKAENVRTISVFLEIEDVLLKKNK
ncbi:MAG: hypothetical protein HY098_07805 [Nitrospinae bacterium]|nr:hypothetical protein [Nitrospinota bacterium]